MKYEHAIRACHVGLQGADPPSCSHSRMASPFWHLPPLLLTVRRLSFMYVICKTLRLCSFIYQLLAILYNTHPHLWRRRNTNQTPASGVCMISMAICFVRLSSVQCDTDEAGCIPHQLWVGITIYRWIVAWPPS